MKIHSNNYNRLPKCGEWYQSNFRSIREEQALYIGESWMGSINHFDFAEKGDKNDIFHLEAEKWSNILKSGQMKLI